MVAWFDDMITVVGTNTGHMGIGFTGVFCSDDFDRVMDDESEYWL